MKKLMLLLVAANLFAVTGIDENGAYQLNRTSRLARQLGVGTNLFGGHWLKAQYDFAVSGGALGTDITLLDHEGQPVKLPDNAIIYDCLIDVVTALTTADADGSIAFSSNAVGDLKGTTLIYPGLRTAETRIACTPTGSASTAVKMSSEATLKMRTGSEAITAGKINIWVNYVVSN